MFTITEILNFLESNFPMCRWQVEPMQWQKGEMIAWRPTQKYRIEVYPGKFAPSAYDGAYMIIVQWDDMKELSGGGSPCLNFDEVEKVTRRAIERFDPKLFEDQQLTLF